jgi:Aspartyl protease
MLRLTDEPFFTGSCPYRNQTATPQERLTRLFITVQVEDQPTDAVLDTGGAYLMLHPEIAESLGLHPESALGTDTLHVRGLTVTGHLHRVDLTLAADEDEGESVRISVTTFVPALTPHTLWDLPTYLGWHGCLERFRFAVDPSQDRFYFAALD